MRDERHIEAAEAALAPKRALRVPSYRFVILTLDAHAAGPAARRGPRPTSSWATRRFWETGA